MRQKSSRPLVIAHRGNSRFAPENTLPAFAEAMALGVDQVELDFHESADGEQVVIHDDTLDRTTNARALWGGEKIRVDSRGYADLARLDAGSWFDPKFSSAHLPTLAAALELITATSHAAVERKAGSADKFIKLVTQRAIVDRVVLQAFEWSFLAECHRLVPKLALAALGDGELTPGVLREIASSGAKILSWDEQRLSRDIVGAIHGAGLEIWAWAVDAPERAAELAAWGVDGIITNDPATILATFA